MSWKEPGGGGPWGGGQGPWGRGPGRPGGPTPPDFDDLFRKGQERIRRIFPPGGFGGGRGILLAVIAIIVLWALTGIYQVAPDEVGVVLRFGRFDHITQPGLNYHLPTPIESVRFPPVTRINRIEIGFRAGGGDSFRGANPDAVNGNENLMLTGDENIVDINFSVFWQIKDPEQFLFNIRDPEDTVKVVAESAMREVIGQLPIRAPLSESRTAIAQRTRDRMQELLNAYKAGITVVQVQLLKADPPAEVIDAFNDVQRAKADQERAGNEAEAYRNSIIPVARGDAERIVQEAEAYKEQTVDLAQGDAQRFVSVLTAYKLAPDVTERRLYIETLEAVLKNAQKIIMDPAAKGIVPYLPLPELGKGRPAQAAPAATSSAAPVSATSATGAGK
jgi:membrane protease subunit HflK